MLRVGLTGGIGSGKSAAATCFQALGVPVIDADVVARDLVKVGLPAYDAIVKTFGEQVLSGDGELDRAKLRRLIFSNAKAKSTLEAILHPLVLGVIRKNTAELDAIYCLIVIPLMIEANTLSLVDRVLVIDVEPEVQIARTLQRDGGSRAEVEAILASQVDRETRLSYAQDIVDNSTDLVYLKNKIARLHVQYLSEAQAHSSAC